MPELMTAHDENLTVTQPPTQPIIRTTTTRHQWGQLVRSIEENIKFGRSDCAQFYCIDWPYRTHWNVPVA